MSQNKQLVTAGRRHKHELEMDVFTAARLRMDHTYENFDVVVVAWSGGKDSTVCLELARESARKYGRLPVDVFFLDEEVIYPETLELVARHLADPEIRLHILNVPSIYRNACSEVEPDFIPWDPTKEELWTHAPFPTAIWPFGTEMSSIRVTPTMSAGSAAFRVLWGDQSPQWRPDVRVAQILGLRTQESFSRYGGMMSSGDYITAPEKGWHKVRPVYDWKASDVWLAIKDFGWDYNRAYEKLWRGGANPISARVAPLFHAEAAMNLRRVMLYWPEFWPLVRRRVRGAHAVAIYNGALHAVERHPGETWQDAATRYLNGLGSADDRQQMYALVNAKLDEHAKHSPFPMADEQKCPECAVSWKLIAKAVARGDRQGRILNPPQTLTSMKGR